MLDCYQKEMFFIWRKSKNSSRRFQIVYKIFETQTFDTLFFGLFWLNAKENKAYTT